MRKYQVFVSSTFDDMRTERQAAVEAILEAGHIPAGMELFTAGDESQLDTIKRWIEVSDVYLLLLGGRYGSIEPKSDKSYVQVEYEYALNRGKPTFAVVIKEDTLDAKVKELGRSAIEERNGPLLEQFRKLVLSKTSRFFSDTKDIKIAIHQKLAELAARAELVGWIRGDQAHDTQLATEIAALSEENRALRARVDALAAQPSTSKQPFTLPANLTDADLTAFLRSAMRQMPDSQKFSVVFFDHLDTALGLPNGTVKRLIRPAIGDLYEIKTTENTVTLSRHPKPPRLPSSRRI